MAHKKGGGSTKNGRDSNPQYRGVKRYGGELVTPGAIIVRQCGTVVHPGHGPTTTIGEEKISNPFLNGTARIVRG